MFTSGVMGGGVSALAWNTKTVSDIITATWSRGEYGAGLFTFPRSDVSYYMYSLDGITWVIAPNPAGSSLLAGLFWDGMKFLALGSSGSRGKIHYSPDGLNWTLGVTASDTSQLTFYDAASNGSIYVAVGDATGTALLYTSPSGTTDWTDRSIPGAATLKTINYSSFSSLFFASGGSVILTSGDGITWTSRTSQLTAAVASAYGNGIAVIVGNGSSGQQIQISTNCTSWTKKGPSGIAFSDAAFGGGIFVAVGATGHIYYSADGDTWTQSTQADAYAGTFQGVAFGGGKFAAVGASTGTIQTSP